MSDPDYVIIGSGINALVAAAMLGKSGKRVLMLERNDRIGGCIRSEEITAPGYIHDVMATTFVLFITSPAYAALAADLGKHGLDFCHSEHPSGVLLPDGRSAVVSMKRAENGAALDRLSPGDGAQHIADVGTVERNAPLLFALLGGQLWSWPTAKLLAREAFRRGSAAAGAILRRGAHHGQGLARGELSVRSRARAVGAVGAAYRARLRKAPIRRRWRK